MNTLREKQHHELEIAWREGSRNLAILPETMRATCTEMLLRFHDLICSQIEHGSFDQESDISIAPVRGHQ